MPFGLLRAVIAVPLHETLCRLIEQLEPRVELVRDHDLTPPMRGPADWSGDPAFVRSPERQEAFERMLDGADALFGIPDVDPSALARTVAANQRLRWVMTTAAGGGSQVRAAGLDRSALERIAFTTSAGVHGAPLAEFAVFGVLAGAKQLPRLVADQRAARWPERWEMRQLDEMTVLVVGLGGIGSECVRAFDLLGARVWGASRSGRSLPGVDRVVSLSELGAAVPEVDVLVLALPGTELTANLIGDALLRGRRGLIVVNVGRGTVIDESALIDALETGVVSFAALDVFAEEPLPSSSPLWSHPRVLVSPHTAALSGKEEERVARQFAANATRLLDGAPMRAVVERSSSTDPSRLDRSTDEGTRMADDGDGREGRDPAPAVTQEHPAARTARGGRGSADPHRARERPGAR